MKSNKTFVRRFGRILMSAAVLASAATAVSAAGYNSIVLSKTDGSRMTVNISDKLETTVSGDNLVFADNSGDIVSVPIVQLSGWSFSAESTTSAISRITDTKGYSVAGNIVTIDGLDAGTEVCVQTVGGVTVMRKVADGTCSLDLSMMVNGVYLITYNKQTIKIAVR